MYGLLTVKSLYTKLSFLTQSAWVFFFAISFKEVNGNCTSDIVNLANNTAVNAAYRTTPNNNAIRTIILPDKHRSFKSKPKKKSR